MIGNLYNYSGNQTQYFLRDISKLKNIVGCFVMAYEKGNFKGKNNLSNTIYSLWEQYGENITNIEPNIKFSNLILTFGYGQEEFDSDKLQLISYDGNSYQASLVQLPENSKSIEARWIHYDESLSKYICIKQQGYNIENQPDNYNIHHYRLVEAITQQPVLDISNYYINWYYESIGELGDQWSGYYWKKLRTTAMFENETVLKAVLEAEGIEGDAEIYNKVLELYTTNLLSPYEAWKETDEAEKTNAADALTILLNKMSIIEKQYAKMYSYFDVIYIPITSSKTIGFKAVLIEKGQEGNGEDEETSLDRLVASSDTMMFYNQQLLESTEYKTLILNIEDEPKQYFLYGEDCQILNSKDAQTVRKIKVEFPQDTPFTSLVLKWKIPMTNSMIQTPVSTVVTDAFGNPYNTQIKKEELKPEFFVYYPGYSDISEHEIMDNIVYQNDIMIITYTYNADDFADDYERQQYLDKICRQSFLIKNYYNITSSNNIIYCEANFDNDAIKASGSKLLDFGQNSSNGTEYNFSIYFEENTNPYFSEEGGVIKPVTVVPQLFSRSIEMPQDLIDYYLEQVTYSSVTNPSYFEIVERSEGQKERKDFRTTINYNNSVENDIYYAEYLQAQVNIEGVILTAYLAIPLRKSTQYTGMQAPGTINYSSQGTEITYLKDPLKLYGRKTEDDINEVVTTYRWQEKSLIDSTNEWYGDTVIWNDYYLKEELSSVQAFKISDPRNWYTINLNTSFSKNTKGINDLVLGQQYVLFNIIVADTTMTTSTPTYDHVVFTLMEKNNNILYVRFTEGTIPTSVASNESWFIGSGKVEENTDNKNSSNEKYADWWIRVYDSDKPCQSYDTGDWYTFEPALNPGTYYLDEDDSAYIVKYIVNLSAYSHDIDTNTYGNKYQISNFYAQSDGTWYYMFEPFQRPEGLHPDFETDKYRILHDNQFVKITKTGQKYYLEFQERNQDYSDFFISDIPSFLSEERKYYIDLERERLESLEEWAEEEDLLWSDEFIDSYPAKFYLTLRLNSKQVYYPFAFSLDTMNSELYDKEQTKFEVQYLGTQELITDEFIYYWRFPQFEYTKSTFEIAGDTFKDVEWRVVGNKKISGAYDYTYKAEDRLKSNLALTEELLLNFKQDQYFAQFLSRRSSSYEEFIRITDKSLQLNFVQSFIEYMKTQKREAIYASSLSHDSIEPDTLGAPSFNIVEQNDSGKVPGIYLQPSPIFITNSTTQYSVVAYRYGVDGLLNSVWIQPIIIRQNLYQSETLNKWNGKTTIDLENNYILSQVIGAGSKDAQNRFSGVFMGKVGTGVDDENIAHGLYGYSNGSQVFAFKENGKAFIGKSGGGRIEFDGENAIITSRTFNDSTQYQGVKIDLDDGQIQIKGNDNKDAHFLISHKREDGKIIQPFTFEPAKDRYWLRSIEGGEDLSQANFSINLKNGEMFASNFKLQAGTQRNGTNTFFRIDNQASDYPLLIQRYTNSQLTGYFGVNNNGVIVAKGAQLDEANLTNATIIGNLNAGSVGNWSITDGKLQSKKTFGIEMTDLKAEIKDVRKGSATYGKKISLQVYSQDYEDYLKDYTVDFKINPFKNNFTISGEDGIDNIVESDIIKISWGLPKDKRISVPDPLPDNDTTFNLIYCFEKNIKPWWMAQQYFDCLRALHSRTGQSGEEQAEWAVPAVTLPFQLAAYSYYTAVPVHLTSTGKLSLSSVSRTITLDPNWINSSSKSYWPFAIGSTSSSQFFGVSFGKISDTTTYGKGIRYDYDGKVVIINGEGIKWYTKDSAGELTGVVTLSVEKIKKLVD